MPWISTLTSRWLFWVSLLYMENFAQNGSHIRSAAPTVRRELRNQH